VGGQTGLLLRFSADPTPPFLGWSSLSSGVPTFFCWKIPPSCKQANTRPESLLGHTEEFRFPEACLSFEGKAPRWRPIVRRPLTGRFPDIIPFWANVQPPGVVLFSVPPPGQDLPSKTVPLGAIIRDFPSFHRFFLFLRLLLFLRLFFLRTPLIRAWMAEIGDTTSPFCWSLSVLCGGVFLDRSPLLGGEQVVFCCRVPFCLNPKPSSARPWTISGTGAGPRFAFP